MIERVTDYVFPKDVTHEAHRGEKTSYLGEGHSV
jgi:hypothetical protein